jgi:RNA polymerase-binding transcription factor DksA
MSDNTERTSDPLDQASLQEEAFRNAALRAIKGTLRETHPDFDGENCMDCEGEIPHERLSLGKIRCVHCQHAKETISKLRGR